MSDYPMLISNKLHSFRNFFIQTFALFVFRADRRLGLGIYKDHETNRVQ